MKKTLLALLFAGAASAAHAGLDKVQNIVVIYPENRSFDHLFGLFPGANGIGNATAEQRERLVNEFRSLLVRVYSTAIDVYRGQTMQVLPVQMAPDATEATVRNRYISPGAAPVEISYAMHKTNDGWKIYDISVEGVSLVLTYRTEFEQIGREAGIEGLIARLAEKNRTSIAG